QPLDGSGFVLRLVSVKAAREAPQSLAMLSPTSSHRSCRVVWAAPALGARASRSAGSAGRSRLRMREIRPARAALSRATADSPESPGGIRLGPLHARFAHWALRDDGRLRFRQEPDR